MYPAAAAPDPVSGQARSAPGAGPFRRSLGDAYSSWRPETGHICSLDGASGNKSSVQTTSLSVGSGGDSRPRVTGGTGPGSRPLPPPLPLPRNFQSSRVTGKRNTGRRVAEREPRLRNHFLEQRMTGPITTDPYLISAAGPAGPARRTRALHPLWRCACRERAGAWNNGPLLSSPVNRHRFPPALSSPRSGARTGPSARGAEGLAASRAAPRRLSPTAWTACWVPLRIPGKAWGRLSARCCPGRVGDRALPAVQPELPKAPAPLSRTHVP